jgi:hypothetical protein
MLVSPKRIQSENKALKPSLHTIISTLAFVQSKDHSFEIQTMVGNTSKLMSGRSYRKSIEINAFYTGKSIKGRLFRISGPISSSQTKRISILRHKAKVRFSESKAQDITRRISKSEGR